MIRLGEARSSAARWLLSQQHESGGWGQQQGRAPNVLNTAEVLIALMDADCDVPAGDQRIQAGKQFLFDRQLDEGDNAGAWARDLDGGIQAPDVLRSAFAVEALLRCGVAATDPSVEGALIWLSRVRTGGAWGFAPNGEPSLLATCAVLTAITIAVDAGVPAPVEDECAVVVNEGVAWVEKNRNPDGSFGEDVGLRAGHTLYALRFLQERRHRDLPVVADHEAQGLSWLRQHPTEASRFTEEVVTLDPGHPRANYQYLYLMDALVVGVFLGAQDADERTSELSRRALLNVGNRWAGGGFKGDRVFTWSTAKCLRAVDAADHMFDEFPEFPPEPVPGQSVNTSKAFQILIALIAVVFLLALIGRLSLLALMALLVVLLAALLLAGKLSEKYFASIVERVLSPLRSPTNPGKTTDV